jgi:hypothetical protein
VTLIEVFVSGWEIECCAPEPIVGERSTWRLDFVSAGGDYPNPELDRDRLWLVTRRADGLTLLNDGPVDALWAGHNGTPPKPGPAQLRGYLYGNAHGPAPDDAPLTTGRIHRVRIAQEEFRLVEPRRLEPVAGTLTLTDVRRSPKWFTGSEAGVHQTGVLLDLVVS